MDNVQWAVEHFVLKVGDAALPTSLFFMSISVMLSAYYFLHLKFVSTGLYNIFKSRPCGYFPFVLLRHCFVRVTVEANPVVSNIILLLKYFCNMKY